jgi:7-carboxy-7-deazaguanine synthase
MYIAEIFYSIQGEGELTGMPSVFVRTSGCNLRCSWCDTKYSSWYPEGEQLSVEEIVQRVLQYPSDYCVLTGGEPMIAKGIHELASRLWMAGKHVTIETAGTVAPMGIACNLASLSPKLSNSTPSGGGSGWRDRHEATRLQPEVLIAWLKGYHYQLKFVVSSSGDIEEIEDLLRTVRRPVPVSQILLMPEGINAEVIRGRDETLVELCKARGYRYCNRLHIELFGNTKGT